MEQVPEPRQREINMKTNYLCMPKFKPTTSFGRNNNRRLSPMSLLDRLRQAVFRIIMLNALSKANHQTDHHGSGGGGGTGTGTGTDHQLLQARGGRYGYNHLNDPRHSEAVADCIEFIKKSGTTVVDERGGSIDCSIDAAAELVFSVPVM